MSEHHHHHHHHYYSGAGRPDRPSPNPHRLRRSRHHRVVAGVCGGLAEYFGWALWKVRLLTFIAFVLFLPFVAVLYLAAALLLPTEPDHAAYRSPEDSEFWREVSTRPRVTFGMLKHRFRAIDGRLADMERAVTSEEYKLHRAFRDLEGDTPRS